MQLIWEETDKEHYFHYHRRKICSHLKSHLKVPLDDFEKKTYKKYMN